MKTKQRKQDEVMGELVKATRCATFPFAVRTYRESPFPRLTVAGCRTVWFFTISTTHFVFSSFSVEEKAQLTCK